MKRIDTFVTRARRWLVAGAVALAATVVAVAPANAQVGGNAGFTDLAARDYLHRDMPIAAEVLELDENQRVILDNLFEDYVEAFEAGWQGTQDKITNMLDNGQAINRENALELVLKPFEDWKNEKERLKREFESGIRSILNERQMERWPEFQRRIVREKTLHQGRLAGESVNLFNIVRDLRLDERSRQNIEPVLDEYAVELHEALERRNRAIREVQGDLFQMIRAGQNPSAQADAQRMLVSRHVAVRDVNDQFRDRLASSLPHEVGRELKAAALERGYPRVYRELPAERIYRQALELEDVDEEMREAINDLYVIFEAELDVLNSRLLAKVREFEPRQLRNEVDIHMARQAGERVSRIEDPTRADLHHRNERANYYVSLLRDLLGEEMFAELPAARTQMGEASRREAAAAARERIRQRRQSQQERGGSSIESERQPRQRRDTGGDTGRRGGR